MLLALNLVVTIPATNVRDKFEKQEVDGELASGDIKILGGQFLDLSGGELVTYSINKVPIFFGDDADVNVKVLTGGEAEGEEFRLRSKVAKLVILKEHGFVEDPLHLMNGSNAIDKLEKGLGLGDGVDCSGERNREQERERGEREQRIARGGGAKLRSQTNRVTVVRFLFNSSGSFKLLYSVVRDDHGGVSWPKGFGSEKMRFGVALCGFLGGRIWGPSESRVGAIQLKIRVFGVPLIW
ncbi:hypothetical protein TorRG33x02_001310 [Trema orientale]|uniref:Uncharacterized protein n=1 Tax=Trema orientale TaxID=63057 RepID=A0A2P5G1D2_TREOI|nr:hypothetical protein TorRG33x02_001310 [Trema orientale]